MDDGGAGVYGLAARLGWHLFGWRRRPMAMAAAHTNPPAGDLSFSPSSSIIQFLGLFLEVTSALVISLWHIVVVVGYCFVRSKD